LALPRIDFSGFCIRKTGLAFSHSSSSVTFLPKTIYRRAPLSPKSDHWRSYQRERQRTMKIHMSFPTFPGLVAWVAISCLGYGSEQVQAYSFYICCTLCFLDPFSVFFVLGGTASTSALQKGELDIICIRESGKWMQFTAFTHPRIHFFHSLPKKFTECRHCWWWSTRSPGSIEDLTCIGGVSAPFYSHSSFLFSHFLACGLRRRCRLVGSVTIAIREEIEIGSIPVRSKAWILTLWRLTIRIIACPSTFLIIDQKERGKNILARLLMPFPSRVARARYRVEI